MFWAITFRTGETVRDLKLGQIWTVVGEDGAGGFYIERNGVRASAAATDLERCDLPSPWQSPFTI